MMNHHLRIRLFDRDESFARDLAVSLDRVGVGAAVCSFASDLPRISKSDADAVVLSWRCVDEELLLRVRTLSREWPVIVLLADIDTAAARLLYLAGAAEIAHPLLPPALLARTLSNAVAVSIRHSRRIRAWQQTA